MTTPTSSMFSAVDYNAENQTLTVTWRKSGKQTVYLAVPESVWTDMQAAESLGKFYLSQIKGQYEATF